MVLMGFYYKLPEKCIGPGEPFTCKVGRIVAAERFYGIKPVLAWVLLSHLRQVVISVSFEDV